MNTKMNMDRDAALMAAKGMRPAPVVPTTNFSMPNKAKKVSRIGPASMAPAAPQAQMQSQAAGQAAGQMQGFMNVTGPGQRGSNAVTTPAGGVGNGRISVGNAGTWRGAMPPGTRVDGTPSPGRGPDPGFNPDGTPQQDPDATTAESMQKVIDELLSQSVRDTTEEERIINEDMVRNTSQGQADLMARLGASGFGTSGAASAMMGDISSRAALNAARMVQDTRQGARDDYMDRMRLGLEAGGADRRLDMTEDQYTRYLQVLESIFGPDGGSSGGGTGGPDIGGITTGWGDSPGVPSSGRQSGAGSQSDPYIVSAPPAGAVARGTNAQGQKMYMVWNEDTNQYDHYTVVSGG